MATFTERGSGEYVTGEGHYLHLPKRGFSGRYVCIVHAGRTQTHTVTAPPANSVQAALADRGIASIGADFSTGTTWGNDTSITRVGQLITWLTGRGAPSTKYLLYGVSMGSLVLLNWARANASQVAAYAGVIPAVDLADLHDFNRGGYAAEIETAYGGAAGYTAAVATHNPATATASFTFPVRVWYSTNDPVCIPSTATTFASATGGTAVPIGALGHATDDRTAELVEFFTAYA